MVPNTQQNQVPQPHQGDHLPGVHSSGRSIFYVTHLDLQVALDQGVLTPGVVAFFFTSMTFLEGKGVGEAKERLEKVCALPA